MGTLLKKKKKQNCKTQKYTFFTIVTCKQNQKYIYKKEIIYKNIYTKLLTTSTIDSSIVEVVKDFPTPYSVSGGDQSNPSN